MSYRRTCIELIYKHTDGTYRVIVRIVKAGCHPVAIALVVYRALTA